MIYDWLAKEDRIYMLTRYGKGAKADLTSAERDAGRKAVEEVHNG